jgi:hypothetical protein
MAQRLINEQKENRGYRDHDEHHQSRDPYLFPTRPSHLCGFLPNFLNKGYGIELRHLIAFWAQNATTCRADLGVQPGRSANQT